MLAGMDQHELRPARRKRRMERRDLHEIRTGARHQEKALHTAMESRFFAEAMRFQASAWAAGPWNIPTPHVRPPIRIRHRGSPRLLIR